VHCFDQVAFPLSTQAALQLSGLITILRLASKLKFLGFFDFLITIKIFTLLRRSITDHSQVIFQVYTLIWDFIQIATRQHIYFDFISRYATSSRSYAVSDILPAFRNFSLSDISSCRYIFSNFDLNFTRDFLSFSYSLAYANIIESDFYSLLRRTLYWLRRLLCRCRVYQHFFIRISSEHRMPINSLILCVCITALFEYFIQLRRASLFWSASLHRFYSMTAFRC
jgi:hypothetical protein